MKIPALILPLCGALAVSLVVAQEELADQPVPQAVPTKALLPEFTEGDQVVSHTRQFFVFGGEPGMRGTAANLAEETKDEFLRLLEEQDEWKIRIGVELSGQPGDPVPLRTTAMELFFGEQGYQIKVHVNLSRDLQRDPFKRAITSALIYERGLRERAEAETEVPFSVPPWLIEGLQEATAWRLQQSDRRLYDKLFQHSGLFQLRDLFAVSEAGFHALDAVSKAAFRVSSGALVMALLEQPEGKTGFRDFLAEVAPFQGEMPSLLRRHFPELNLSENSMAKWWALQLANKGTAPLTESLSVAETERGLEEALRIRHRDAEGDVQEIPFHQWQQASEMTEAERIESVRLAQDDLLRLSYRSFPSYRALLVEYQALLEDFAKGTTAQLPKMLGALSETRQTMVKKAEMARDFMDYFEITRARETSGAFEDYLKLKARLKDQPNRRTDDLSKYLDRLDPLFALPEESRSADLAIDGVLPF